MDRWQRPPLIGAEIGGNVAKTERKSEQPSSGHWITQHSAARLSTFWGLGHFLGDDLHTVLRNGCRLRVGRRRCRALRFGAGQFRAANGPIGTAVTCGPDQSQRRKRGRTVRRCRRQGGRFSQRFAYAAGFGAVFRPRAGSRTHHASKCHKNQPSSLRGWGIGPL